MTHENGPDRELGLWQAIGTHVYAVSRGKLIAREVSKSGDSIGAKPFDSCHPSAFDMLLCGVIPLDAIAKREAIRAGWREVNGKWGKDERDPWRYRFRDEPKLPLKAAFESAAKASGEWPVDEPAPEAQPEPIKPKPVTPYRAAKQALKAATDDAFDRGREHERRKMAQKARPCVLKRLSDGTERTFVAGLGEEVAVAVLLGAAIAQAKRSGVDLSDLAERMAGGQG